MSKKREKKRERAFLENGRLVLEKLVASCDGRPIPIRTFSYQQLVLATNNFDQRLILHTYAFYIMYKGSFEGRILSIKIRRLFEKELPLMDLGISAKMSTQKNILKLVGCCLDTSIPSSVFEYAQNGILFDQIYNRFLSHRTPMLWQSRLKIARQIAHAIAYLHTAFSRPIIHRNITLGNILLDEHDVPKLSDFSFSVSIPEGETYVEDAVGGLILACPIYRSTGRITEKTDVFSFGMALLQILTQKGHHQLKILAYENIGMPMVNSFEDYAKSLKLIMVYLRNHAILNEIVDPAILAEEGGVGVEQQLSAVWQLALTCIEYDPEIRSTMVDVTKELRWIERSIA